MNLPHIVLTFLADEQERRGDEATQRGDTARAVAHYEASELLGDALVALQLVEEMETVR